MFEVSNGMKGDQIVSWGIMLKGIIIVLALASCCLAQATQPVRPTVPENVIAQWEAAQPELKKAELADIPRLIARSEKWLREAASFQAKTPEARKSKRERLERERAEITAIRARRNALQHDPSSVAYGSLGELEMGTIGLPDRLSEFRVVQVIDSSNMLVDYWSAETVKTLVHRRTSTDRVIGPGPVDPLSVVPGGNGVELDDDSTPISEMPENSGFDTLVTHQDAKSVWLSGISTNGLADGNWLPKSRTPLFVAGTRQFTIAAGSSRTVIYVVPFSPPTTQPAKDRP